MLGWIFKKGIFIPCYQQRAYKPFRMVYVITRFESMRLMLCFVTFAYKSNFQIWLTYLYRWKPTQENFPWTGTINNFFCFFKFFFHVNIFLVQITKELTLSADVEYTTHDIVVASDSCNSGHSENHESFLTFSWNFLQNCQFFWKERPKKAHSLKWLL